MFYNPITIFYNSIIFYLIIFYNSQPVVIQLSFF